MNIYCCLIILLRFHSNDIFNEPHNNKIKTKALYKKIKYINILLIFIYNNIIHNVITVYYYG